MNTDFEKDLRLQMTWAADAAEIPVDLDNIVDVGGRALHRRNQRRAAVTSAIAAVALVGGGVAYWGFGGTSGEPAGVPSAGVPAAVGASATLSGMVQTYPGEPEAIQVRVVSMDADGRYHLSVNGRTSGGKAVGDKTFEAVLPGGQQSMTIRPTDVCKLCLVHVVRGEAAQIYSETKPGATPVDDGSDGMSGSGATVLGGGALTVSAEAETGSRLRMPTGKALDLVSGLVWRTPDWTVHSSSGQAVPTAEFTVDAQRILVFVDREQDLFGRMSEDSYSSVSIATGQGIGRLMTSTEGATSAVGWLPANSKVTSAVWVSGEKGTVQQQEVAGLGTVYLASSKANGSILKSITYRTADGTSRTLRL